jgi:hypothetical protein
MLLFYQALFLQNAPNVAFKIQKVMFNMTRVNNFKIHTHLNSIQNSCQILTVDLANISLLNDSKLPSSTPHTMGFFRTRC